MKQTNLSFLEHRSWQEVALSTNSTGSTRLPDLTGHCCGARRMAGNAIQAAIKVAKITNDEVDMMLARWSLSECS